MEIRKTVTITLEPEEKEIVKQFNSLISNMCKNLRGDCDICPIKRQCDQVAKALGHLETL